MRKRFILITIKFVPMPFLVIFIVFYEAFALMNLYIIQKTTEKKKCVIVLSFKDTDKDKKKNNIL